MLQLLKSIHLRRLHWAVTSPSLMNYSVSTAYFRDTEHEQAILEKLVQLDSENEIVDSHFSNLPSLPMGKYFEQLIFFLIAHDNRIELILSNQQIKEGNRTIGEIDLIIKDTQTNKVEHWEICLKYYLQSSPSKNPKLMIGSNAVDNLARKTDKLLNQQLPLSRHTSLRHITKPYNVDYKLFMKGQLFYHLIKDRVIPQDVNRQSQTGWWCFLSETDEIISQDLKWTILSKPDWIGLHQLYNDSSLLSQEQLADYLQNHFTTDSNSILTVGMKESKNGWIEQTRGFVVNNNWPHLIPQRG